VQALLQAEARVSLFERIGLVVFLRTDLFELYDIQEKNKLVPEHSHWIGLCAVCSFPESR
jgi:hypothetical protein